MTVSISRYWEKNKRWNEWWLCCVFFFFYFYICWASHAIHVPCASTCDIHENLLLYYLISWNTVFRLKSQHTNKMMMHLHLSTNQMIAALLRDQSPRSLNRLPLYLLLNLLLHLQSLDYTNCLVFSWQYLTE